MASNINIKVKTDDLISISSQISTEIKNLENEWRSISSVIKKTSGYWIGDASQQHQNNYRELDEEIGRLILQLKDRPDELLKMADLYEATEQEAIQSANELSDNVII